MKSIDDYKSLIRLLEEVLKFYTYEKEYDDETSLIRQDKGHQARFGLEKIKEFNNRDEIMLDNFKELLDIPIGDVTNMKEFGETMEILKNLEILNNLNNLND